MPIKKKTKKLKPQDKKLIEEIIRVDHAGEHGATQIYRGQLAIFNEHTEFGKEIKEMAEQEEIHKSTFDELIVKEDVKPTIMFPIWNIAGYALGVGTALLGKKAAMACTVAVEEVIGQHYEEQAEELKKRKSINTAVGCGIPGVAVAIVGTYFVIDATLGDLRI